VSGGGPVSKSETRMDDAEDFLQRVEEARRVVGVPSFPLFFYPKGA
jgi:hypothetical protein